MRMCGKHARVLADRMQERIISSLRVEAEQ